MAVTIDGDGLIELGGTSSTQGRVRLAEDSDNGTNYIELTAPASVGSDRVITFPDATTTVVGTDTTQTLTNKTIQGGAVNSGTAQATTSGTSIDFTGIPSWVKRITLMNVGVSTNGSSTLMVQLGTSGGIDTTSTYKGSSWQANITITNFSNGVLLGNSNSAGVLNNHQVVFTLALPSSNTWVVGGVGSGDAGNPQVLAGSKALSGALTTLRLTTANGTDTFDAGSTNILYE